jgi:hypothetical protein
MENKFFVVLQTGECCGIFAHLSQAVEVAKRRSEGTLPFSHPACDVVTVVTVTYEQTLTILRHMDSNNPLPAFATPDSVYKKARNYYDGLPRTKKQLRELYERWEAANELPLPE